MAMWADLWNSRPGSKLAMKFDIVRIFHAICVNIVHGSADQYIIEVIYASALSVFEFSFVP